VGHLNESGQLVDEDEAFGHIDGDQLLKSNVTLLNIEH
jgi:hypothetical protein